MRSSAGVAIEMCSLGTINLESLASNILVRLLAGRRHWGTNNQLGLEFPSLRHIPCRLDLLVNERVVMLEAGAKTLGLESGPGSDLVGAAGLRGPLWEAVGVKSEVGLEPLNGWGINEEEDLPGC